MFTLYGPRRWVGIADPKGEYVALAQHLGLTVIRLAPGGGTRVTPLAPGPAARHQHPEKTAMRRADTVHDLLAAVLHRNLAPAEEAILYAAVEAAVTGRAKNPPSPTSRTYSPRRPTPWPPAPAKAMPSSPGRPPTSTTAWPTCSASP